MAIIDWAAICDDFKQYKNPSLSVDIVLEVRGNHVFKKSTHRNLGYIIL